MSLEAPRVQVVLVHGIRTSATMWRSQVEHLTAQGVEATAVDLPGHGARMDEIFTLDAARSTIDSAVRTAAARGPVLLVGHSMGGLLATEYVGAAEAPPVAAFVAACCTAIPRGIGLRTYRALAAGLNVLPNRGLALTEAVLRVTLPEETRSDFGAGGFAHLAQDIALRSLASLDLVTALKRIRIPTWFVNGQFDQLRLHERLFTSLVPHAELIVVPRSTHLMTAMQPRVFNAVLDLAVATVEAGRRTGSAS